ncbi:hypothetical protein LX36DRAFT_499767 [Colletotrichum falcatum]|nr:hypothetical protein LX36DRAFT_499767 [Colletotrichum falcatum]
MPNQLAPIEGKTAQAHGGGLSQPWGGVPVSVVRETHVLEFGSSIGSHSMLSALWTVLRVGGLDVKTGGVLFSPVRVSLLTVYT